MEKKEILINDDAFNEWKKLGITECRMEFSCGGDSMNDYSFNYYKNKKKVESEYLDKYFEDEVFKNVNFYEASDGYYQGESGEVIITMIEDEEDENGVYFNYDKQARAEYNESYDNVIDIELTKDEFELLKNKITNINGGTDENVNVNYKGDVILSNKEIEVLQSLKDKIYETSEQYEPDQEGELSDWYSFTTDIEEEDNQEVIIENHKLKLNVSKTMVVYRDSDW